MRLGLALGAARCYAMAHNYYMPPFGPFRRRELDMDHFALLTRLDAVLSPSAATSAPCCK